MLRGRTHLLALLTLVGGCAEAREAVTPPRDSSPPLPPSAHVERLQSLRVVLRGDAVAAEGGVSCGLHKAAQTPSYVQLDEDTTANVVLQPMSAKAALRITHLSTQRTWCVTTEHEGAGARIPGNFEPGVYAIEVESAVPKQPYQVTFERL